MVVVVVVLGGRWNERLPPSSRAVKHHPLHCPVGQEKKKKEEEEEEEEENEEVIRRAAHRKKYNKKRGEGEGESNNTHKHKLSCKVEGSPACHCLQSEAPARPSGLGFFILLFSPRL